jgi:hypothetical protein
MREAQKAKQNEVGVVAQAQTHFSDLEQKPKSV